MYRPAHLPQPQVQVPASVIALAHRNKHRWFLASKENTFGSHKAEVVMVDSGCNTMLLPLLKSQLKNLP
jgi:hypothetical protein